MSLVRNFVKIRQDGKRITENMRPADVAKLGPFVPVVQLIWEADGKSISVSNEFGVWGIVVSGKKFVAIKKAIDNTRKCLEVEILNSDGTVRHIISNHQAIEGVQKTGSFSWFESLNNTSKNQFGVIFRPDGDGDIFQLNVDADKGHVISVRRTR